MEPERSETNALMLWRSEPGRVGYPRPVITSIETRTCYDGLTCPRHADPETRCRYCRNYIYVAPGNT